MTFGALPYMLHVYKINMCMQIWVKTFSIMVGMTDSELRNATQTPVGSELKMAASNQPNSWRSKPLTWDLLSIHLSIELGPIFFSEPFQCLKAPAFPTVFCLNMQNSINMFLCFHMFCPTTTLNIAPGIHFIKISIRPEKIHQSIHQYSLIYIIFTYTVYDHVIWTLSFGSLPSPQQLGACAIAVPQNAEG